jgi:phosphoribosylglycinamide formyltransferase-1
MLSVGVLASGAGSNLQALLDACSSGRVDARVQVVVCNVPGAGALAKAEKAGVPSVVLDHRSFPSRDAFEEAIDRELDAKGVELVVLAGFMRILGAPFVSRRRGRILNVHPSLLPAFPGMSAVRQALAAGVRVSGCTVHLVDEGMDTGPIVAQAAVPVFPTDDEHSLHERIRRTEHQLLPHAVQLFARGQIHTADGKVRLDLPRWSEAPLLSPGTEQA